MENKRIRYIISAMVIALLGIVYVQFVWFRSGVELKRAQFEQSVNDVMYQVVLKVDRAEAVEGMMLSGGSSLMYKSNNKGINTYSIKPNNLNDDDSAASFTLKSRTKQALDTIDGYVKKTSTTVQQIENVNIPPFNLPQEFIDSLTGSIKFSSDISIDYQTALIENVMAEMFLRNFQRNINERISGLALDSLIYNELQLHGIKVPYKFGLFNQNGDPVLNRVCREHNLDSVSSITSYRARLFPNDTFGQPYFLHLSFPNEKAYFFKRLSLPVTFSILFIIIIAIVFYVTINGIFRQRDLAIIKNDFINNMTHELKTPIATISLACEALIDGSLSKSEELKNSFISTISEENNRLGVLVENALTTSIIDKGELKLKLEPINLQDVLQQAIRNSQLTANKKGGNIELELPDHNVDIYADKLHFTNVIYNLIDNAIKYSGKNPKVKVALIDQPKSFKLIIQDNGIGISKENQKKIFDKLYRVPTGNVHTVRGYGLGLSYVKAIVSKHGGKISVNSTVGKGSTFTLIFNKQQT